MNPQVLQLAEALQPFLQAAGGPKYKVTGLPSGTPSTPYYTGPAGLFGVLGLERDLISSRVQPRSIVRTIPVVPTNEMNPLVPYLTGFQATTGTEKTNVCDDPPTAASGKSCLQTAVFGRYERQTRELELNHIGQRINRGEFSDMTILNDPLANEVGGVFAQAFGIGKQNARMLGQEMLMRILEVGVSFQNLLCPQVFTGNPDNNKAGGGYKEFIGLDILISTGKRDAITGTACPALDPDVKDFNYGRVDATNLNPDIVDVVTYLYRYIKRNAAGMGFNPVQWRWAMREDLFYELTAVWPCSYLTYRCKFRATDGTIVENVSANDAIQFRDTMRAGYYLLIDGEQVPVEIDDAITEESSAQTNKLSAGSYASTMYLLPYTIMGGRPTLFFQHYDYSNGPMQAAQQANYQNDFWTDGGRFLWHNKPPINWCVQLIAKIEPRLILLTPQLAGKITHVAYKPLQHTRDAFPNQTYFVDGGVTTGRDAPSWYVKPA